MTEIRIKKNERCLELHKDGELLKTYRVGLGFTPVGKKKREGDGKVPEGEYYICTKNEQSKFTLFLGLSYPNKIDAEEGLKTGLISEEEHDRILKANEERRRPDWETDLGGKIGIHGKGSAFDWTAGCVALDDEDIRDLWQYMEIGDAVYIEP